MVDRAMIVLERDAVGFRNEEAAPFLLAGLPLPVAVADIVDLEAPRLVEKFAGLVEAARPKSLESSFQTHFSETPNDRLFEHPRPRLSRPRTSQVPEDRIQ